MGYWDHDYSAALVRSHLSVDALTRHLEQSLFEHAAMVADDPNIGGLLAEVHRKWSETAAVHADPVAALLRDAEEFGGVPAGIDVFDQVSGDIDLVSLVVVVNMLRRGDLRPRGGQ